MKEFIEYCKDYIYEHIHEYKDSEIWMDELGWMLTEGPNMDGTLTFSARDAEEYLSEWSWEAGDFLKYVIDNYGAQTLEKINPFHRPEAYMVAMVQRGVEVLIGEAIGYVEFEEGKQVLTGDMIEHIVESVANNMSDNII